MIVETLCGFVAVVLALVLFLQYAEQNGPIKGVRQFLAKEVIIAMSQRPSAANRTSKYDDDVLWVRRFVSNSCAALEFVPYGLKLRELVDEFCDRIDNVLDVYETNLLEHETRLAEITAVRQSVEKELAKEQSNTKSTRRSVVMTGGRNRGRIQQGVSARKASRPTAIKACTDVDDDKCFMNALSRLVYSQTTGRRLHRAC